MRTDLEDRLGKDFSFMNRIDENGNRKSIYIEIGDGWYKLLHNLCCAIESIYKEEKVEVDILVEQVKEKYGTLSFDYYFRDEHRKNQKINSFSSNGDRYKERIGKIVSKMEDLSETVCEQCGGTGVIRDDGGWLTVLCDDCYKS